MARYLLRSARELDYYDRSHNIFPRLSLLCADTLCGAIRTFPHMVCQLQATQNGYHRGKCVLNGTEVVLPLACPHRPHLSIMACTTSSGMPALVIVASSVTLQALYSPGTERHPVQLDC